MKVREKDEETRRFQPDIKGKIKDKFLIIIDANGKITEVQLSSFRSDRIYFGRDHEQNDLVIQSGAVSRTHGKFKLDMDRLLYADLGSTNGTILERDGYQEVLRGGSVYKELKNGDMLRIQSGRQASDEKNSILILYMDNTEEGVWIKFPMLGSRTTIGRDLDNDIVLHHPGVSRTHAVIEKKDNKFVLSDNRSVNGVLVNGHTLNGSRVLQEKDVIRILSSTLIYAAGMIFYKNSAKGINIEVRDMNKYVGKNKKKILDHVDCTIESNEFVAIIGGSGAGKSTLMNAISGFDKKVDGTVLFNGIDLHSHFDEMKTLIGYVPQEDIIYENLTLRKMLYYTAKLKMPGDTSKAEIESRITKVLDMVELGAHQNTYIRKLSGGQKKRASIAVELLADPRVFFLDEPTSGLDPGTEQKLMITLRKLSKSQGKTIIMVTHTTQSLQLCDKVIFMGQGGRLCFCGTTEQAKMFFDTDNLVDIYNMISENSEMWAEQYRRCVEGEKKKKVPKPRKIARRQKGHAGSDLFILIRRYLELIKNDTQRLTMLFLQPVLIALLLSLVANENVFEIYEDTKSILFALSCAGIWIGLFNSIQEICKERVILKREYMANLKLPVYIASKFLVQTLLGAMQSFLMITIFAFAVGMPEEGIFLEAPYLEMYVTLFLTVEASMALGFVISSLVKSGDKAMTLAPFVLIIQLLFSGILFELKDAAEYIAWVTISKWSVESFGSLSRLNDLTMKIQKDFPQIEHEAQEIFEATVSHLSMRWGIMAGMMLVCAVLCTFLLRSLSKDSR